MDPTLLILDVKEHETGAAKAPSFPQVKSTSTGFPEHKKRTKVSAFKQKRQAETKFTDVGEEKREPTGHVQSSQVFGDRIPQDIENSEKQRIDRENTERLASMAPEEIEEARQELFSGLDPSLIQMLLKRANLDDATSQSPFDVPASTSDGNTRTTRPERIPEIQIQKPDSISPSAEPSTTSSPKKPATKKVTKKVTFDEDAAPPEVPDNLFPAASEAQSSATESLPTNTTHFPQPKAIPDLNPADPDFIANLHEKYFPNLPSDPSKLAWMAPVPTPDSVADRDSPYYPGQSSLPVSALRFDFRGALLPPRVSRAISTSKGLHHHGEAPEAAGYTIPELARLARSAVPAQRCVAFQTLGRILYRLGKGEWGAGESAIAMGMWRTAQENRVMDSLLDAAGVPEGQGHRGSRAYAIEALWLFEKGGWKEKWHGR